MAATLPMPGEMETVLAPEVLQLKVDCPPAAMLFGLATKRTICAVVASTVTVTGAVTVLPSAPVALIVYVVVVAGETVALPLAATLPMPGKMDTVVAPEVVQLKVDCPPAAMVLGLATKRTI